MTKEIGVKFSINGKDMFIFGKVSSKYDKDENLIVEFSIGKTKQDKVKLVFDKRTYLDIADE